MRGRLSSRNRSTAPEPGVKAVTVTAPVATSATTRVPASRTPSLSKANHMMTPPPTISALPWIRSAQAQAFRPPADDVEPSRSCR